MSTNVRIGKSYVEVKHFLSANFVARSTCGVNRAGAGDTVRNTGVIQFRVLTALPMTMSSFFLEFKGFLNNKNLK